MKHPPLGASPSVIETLDQSTESGVRRIFFRFVAVMIAINIIVGTGVIIYEVGQSLSRTESELKETATILGTIADRLHDQLGHEDLKTVGKQLADLLNVPLLLMSQSGDVVFARSEAEGALFSSTIPRVFPTKIPQLGLQAQVRQELQDLSGVWYVKPFGPTINLVMVVPYLPEQEGILRYMTIVAGLMGLGLLVSFAVMVMAANWMLRRPLNRMVKELQMNEMQLIQNSKMASLGEMATGVAHELNQPLNNINLLCSRLLKRVAELPEKEREFFQEKLEKAQGQIERADKIIHQLKKFGRRSVRQIRAVSLVPCVQSVAELFEVQFEKEGIELAIDLDPSLPQVFADETELEQVLINLLNNAKDALLADDAPWKQTKNITISASTTPPEFLRERFTDAAHLFLSVNDNGPGMPTEIAERIFEPFFTTKEVGKGTGLGLSISYSLMQGFGGELAVHAKPNEGAIFVLILTRADLHAPRS